MVTAVRRSAVAGRSHCLISRAVVSWRGGLGGSCGGSGHGPTMVAYGLPRPRSMPLASNALVTEGSETAVSRRYRQLRQAAGGRFGHRGGAQGRERRLGERLDPPLDRVDRAELDQRRAHGVQLGLGEL